MTASRVLNMVQLKPDGMKYAYFPVGKPADGQQPYPLDVFNLNTPIRASVPKQKGSSSSVVVDFKSPSHFLYASMFEHGSRQWNEIVAAKTPEEAKEAFLKINEQARRDGTTDFSMVTYELRMQDLLKLCESQVPGFKEALAATGDAYIYPDDPQNPLKRGDCNELSSALMVYRETRGTNEKNPFDEYYRVTRREDDPDRDRVQADFVKWKQEKVGRHLQQATKERQGYGVGKSFETIIRETQGAVSTPVPIQIPTTTPTSAPTSTPTPLSTLPSVDIGGQRVAPFKDPEKVPYGAFANTTKAGKYPVKQEVEIHGKKLSFNWPSSEQAYHGQKLINLMKALPKDDPRQAVLEGALKKIETTVGPDNEFHPNRDFKKIVEDMIRDNPTLDFGKTKAGFENLCVGGDGVNDPGDKWNLQTDFMREVIKLKFDQHPELKERAMQMAREGVIPVEYSTQDKKWASGKDGDGQNLLGILILEEGNRLLQANGETPKIEKPYVAYQAMQATNKDALSHDTLNSAVSKPPKPPVPKPKSTTGGGTTPDTGSDLAKARSELDGLTKAAKTAADRAADLERKVATLEMSAGDAETKAEDLSKVAARKVEEHAGLVLEQKKAEELLGTVQQNLSDVDRELTEATDKQTKFKRVHDDFKSKDAERIRLQDVRNDAERALNSEPSDEKRAAFEAANKAYQEYIAPKGPYAEAKAALDSFEPPKKASEIEAELKAEVERLTAYKAESKAVVESVERAVEDAKLKVNTAKSELTQAQTLASQARVDADNLKEPLNQARQEAKAAKDAATVASKKVDAQQKVVEQAEAKTTSSTPDDDAKKEAEEKKEAAKKEAEQKKREAEQEKSKKMAFAQLYSDKRGWPRKDWENIYDPNSGQKDADKDTPRLSSGSGDNDFETKPGRYRHPKHGDKFDIRYGEDGSVKPIPPSKFGVWNKEGYSASMDFLAGKLGASTIKISLPMATDERLKSHNKKQLRQLLQMAHKKGLSVEFDQNTLSFLDTLSPREASRFLRARDLLAQNAMKNEMLVGAGDTKELNNAKIKADEGILDGKATEAEYTKSKLDGKTTIDDKLSVVDAELDKLDKHASDMRDLNQRMQSLSKAAEGLLSKPDNLADLHREHIYRTKWQRFKDLIRPNVRENAKRYEDYSQGIADIERKFEKDKDRRGSLVQSIDKKLDKLESLRAEWKKELDKLKSENGSKPDSDPGKKKLEDKIKKLEKKLDDIDGKLKEGKKEVAELKKNEQDFKAKIVAAREKAEEYKASKQAKIGN